VGDLRGDWYLFGGVPLWDVVDQKELTRLAVHLNTIINFELIWQKKSRRSSRNPSKE
jgi:hypothetical protein